jgi:hypothetical protein
VVDWVVRRVVLEVVTNIPEELTSFVFRAKYTKVITIPRNSNRKNRGKIMVSFKL